MSSMRQQSYEAVLAAIASSPLPDAQKAPLVEAFKALYAKRPNVVDKVQAPRPRTSQPDVPQVWQRCVEDIPGSKLYEQLRTSADAIRAFVEKDATS